MTRLHIRMLLTAAVAVVLVPAFAYAEADTPAKKEIAGGRQRLNPRTGDDVSQLSGTPVDAVTPMPQSSMLGFGPMSGNPLFGGGLPLKSGN